MAQPILDRENFVLAALSPSGSASYSPVQVQKLLFLLDRNVSDRIGGPFFDFQPYDYGPFDRSVYAVLENLHAKQLVDVAPVPGRRWNMYKLTESGQTIGDQLRHDLSSPVNKYMENVSQYVRRQSFADLVSAIYQQYPEMKENSVFQG